MTDLTALTAIASPAAADIFYIVDDPAGTPLPRKVTLANLLAFMDANSTGAAILASTSNGEGAALVGIEDAGGLITATTVEGALAEIQTAVDVLEAAGYITPSSTSTLTNKTLTAPVLSGTVTGTYTLGGTPTFPATVVSTTGTQTLTNKTLTFANNTLTNVMSTSTAQSVTAGIKKTFQANGTNAGFRLAGVTASPSTLVAGDIWYRSDSSKLNYRGSTSVRALVAEDLAQTLTNKTISSASNTMTINLASATVTGTTAEFNTALSDGSFATLAGTETLTNKTINGDNNTISNLDLGNEVDWAAADDVTDRTAFASGDKVLIYEAGVGMRKVDYDDLPGAGGGLSNVVEDTTPQLGGALDVNGNAIVSVTNGDIDITPNGTGNVTLGNFAFNADQTVGAGQDNYVLTYDDASGLINLEAATGGGNVSNTGTPANNQFAVWTDATTIEGISALTFDATSFTITADLDPNADGTINLGNSTNRFASISVDSIDLNGTTLDGTALADPGADRLLFWDDSAGSTAYLTASTGLSISTTNISVDTSVVTTLTGTQTLTNKTLTDPKIAHAYNAQTGTTYTLVLADQSKLITMSNASANTLTIPTNASVAFPVGTIIEITQLGAGTTTIAGDTGVTLSGNGGSASAGSCDIQTRYNSATIRKITTDSWLVAGDIDAVA